MANRRMFSLKVIDTDLFLDMPISTQLLYFHLALRADDDGFVSSPRKIAKMVNCSDDDMKILIAKQFLIRFDTGVCVIRHWRIHNYIQKDRYTPTMYKFEKNMLSNVNNTYEINGSEDLDTECIQNVSEVDTQVRLGKVRLELGKSKRENIEEENSSLSYQSIELCKYWQELKPNESITKDITTLKTFIEQYGFDWTKDAMQITAQKKNRFIPSYIVTILKNWSAEGKEESNGQNTDTNSTKENNDSPYDFSKI